MVLLIIGDSNNEFFSQVGEDPSKYTAMAIMDEVKRTVNTSTEGVEEAVYVRTIPTAGTEVIDNLTNGYPGSTEKRLKFFVPTGIETISDTLIDKFISKLQVHLNHSAEVIVGAQASISLRNSKIRDVPEDHRTIWCAMGDITKKLISHGAFLENIDLDSLMREAMEAYILTAKIKNLWMMLWDRQHQQLPRLDLCMKL